jgi:nucleoside-diphosphate-sugar epimerase
MPSAAVTGITGCLGRAVAPAFTARGYDVRGLVRTPGAVAAQGFEEHVGDLTRPETLRDFCDGADVVVHAAALVSDWDDPATFGGVNVTGTEALLEDALRHGVGRFVYVSTVDIFGFPRGGVLSERSPERCVDHPYSRTKLAAEAKTWDAARRGLPVSVIYPTWLIGPGDRHLVPELVDGLRTRQLVYFDRGSAPLELTYSENLAEAIALVAGTPAAAGEGYIVGDGFGLTLGGLIDRLAASTGLARPRFSVPFRVAWAVGGGSELVAKVTRSSKRPLLTRYAVVSVGAGTRYDLGKIRALGYRPPVDAEEAVRRTVAALEGEAAERKESEQWAAL